MSYRRTMISSDRCASVVDSGHRLLTAMFLCDRGRAWPSKPHRRRDRWHRRRDRWPKMARDRTNILETCTSYSRCHEDQSFAEHTVILGCRGRYTSVRRMDGRLQTPCERAQRRRVTSPKDKTPSAHSVFSSILTALAGPTIPKSIFSQGLCRRSVARAFPGIKFGSWRLPKLPSLGKFHCFSFPPSCLLSSKCTSLTPG